MATYRVTSPEGVTYRVEGPEGASQEEVLSQIEAYKGTKPAAPEETQALTGESYVKPGDVEGAKRKLGVSGTVATGFTNEKPENTVVPRLGGSSVFSPIVGPVSEFGKGIGEAAGGVIDLFTKNPMYGPETPASSPLEVVGNIAASPIGRIATGVAQAASSPLAPMSDFFSAGSELANDFIANTLGMPRAADVVSGGLKATSDVLAPGAIGKFAKALRPGIKNIPQLQSTRQQVRNLETKLQEAETSAAEKLRKVELETNQSKRFAQEVAEEQKQAIPSKEELQARFAPNAPLGKEAGEAWVSGYKNKLSEVKGKFKKEYTSHIDEGAQQQVLPTSYAQAGGVVRKQTGVTGIPRTGPAESVAKRLEKVANYDEFIEDQYNALRKQLREVDPTDKGRVQGVLDEFIAKNELGEMPTVGDLILERQRLKAGQRAARGDAAKAQFNPLIDGLNNDIATANPTLFRKVLDTDIAYKKEFVPYFAEGSVTRAISEKDPNAIVDMIFQPTLKGGRVGATSRAEEVITKARELITDPTEWNKVKGAFTKKIIENAAADGTLSGSNLWKEWSRYKDPTGNANAVLRKAYGDQEFQHMDATFRQLSKSKPETIDKYVMDIVKGLEKQGKLSADSIKAAHEATKKRLVQRISEVSGASTEQVTNRLQSIGSGVFVSGVMRGAGATVLQGAGIVIGSKLVASMLGTVKGRNLLKAMSRSAPGTAQRAATARQIENFASNFEEEED